MKSRKRITVAAIIVNYNAAEYAVRATNSLLTNSTSPIEVTVHLIDNNSNIEDYRTLINAQVAHSWGDSVDLRLEKTNHGFGRANNIIIDYLSRQSDKPDYVFLLNPDAYLTDNALEILVQQLEESKHCAAAGSAISLPSGLAVNAAFKFPSLLTEIASKINFGPVSRLLGGTTYPELSSSEASEVDWVCGASVLFRGDALFRAQGFDADFFLYFEEVELMYRLKKMGYSIKYVPTALAVHHEGVSTNIDSRSRRNNPKPAYWYDSWRIYYCKTEERCQH